MGGGGLYKEPSSVPGMQKTPSKRSLLVGKSHRKKLSGSSRDSRRRMSHTGSLTQKGRFYQKVFWPHSITERLDQTKGENRGHWKGGMLGSSQHMGEGMETQ